MYMNIKSGEGTVRKGVHAWMTKFQVKQKYGEEDGESIILSLEDSKDPGTVRAHPDDKSGKVGSHFLVSFDLEVKQYWVLDMEAVETRSEEWMERLYQAVDEDSSTEATVPKKRPRAESPAKPPRERKPKEPKEPKKPKEAKPKEVKPNKGKPEVRW